MEAMLESTPETVRVLKLQETRPGLLIRRLLQGREAWKSKCHAAKEEIRAQRVRIRDLEVSRQQWREIADRTDNQNHRLEDELSKLRQFRSANETKSTAKKK